MFWEYAINTLEISVKESKLVLKPKSEIIRKKQQYIADSSGQINNTVQCDAVEVEEI